MEQTNSNQENINENSKLSEENNILKNTIK